MPTPSRVDAVVSLVHDALVYAEDRGWQRFEQTLRELGTDADAIARVREVLAVDALVFRQETISALRASLTTWTLTVH